MEALAEKLSFPVFLAFKITTVLLLSYEGVVASSGKRSLLALVSAVLCLQHALSPSVSFLLSPLMEASLLLCFAFLLLGTSVILLLLVLPIPMLQTSLAAVPLLLVWTFVVQQPSEKDTFFRFKTVFRDRVAWHRPSISEEARERVLAQSFSALPAKSRIAFVQGGEAIPHRWILPFLIGLSGWTFIPAPFQTWLLPVAYGAIYLLE